MISYSDGLCFLSSENIIISSNTFLGIFEQISNSNNTVYSTYAPDPDVHQINQIIAK